MKKRLIYIFILSLVCLNVFPQANRSIAVNRNPAYTNMNPEQLVKSVFINQDAGIQIENFTHRILGWNPNNTRYNTRYTGIGYFHRNGSDFPLEQGLIISPGNVSEAEGPNDNDSALETTSSMAPTRLRGDADLAQLTPGTVYNVGAIEFDFVAKSTIVVFRYIFASEEYPKFANSQYNDAFGLFIHKVGDEQNTKKNIALLPETETSTNVVSINNVNDGLWASYNWDTYYPATEDQKRPRNGNYFVRQIRGSLATEFNGYVYDKANNKPLEAAYVGLIPGEKYHIKIIVGNVNDYDVGSGVFLDAYSFDMTSELEIVANGVEGVSTISQKCGSNALRLKLTEPSTEAVTIDLQYTGAAVNGTHYTSLDGTPLPARITIPANTTSYDIPFILTDEAVHGSTFDVETFRSYQGTPISTAKRTVTIFNNYPSFEIHKSLPCSASETGSIQIETASGSSDGYEYSIDNGISWQTTPSFSNLPLGQHNLHIRNTENCDETVTPIAVDITLFSADAGADITDCTDTFTMQASPLDDGQSGVWTVVSPSSGVTIANPTSNNTTVSLSLSQTKTATLRWTVNNGNCSAYDEVTINFRPCGIPVNPHLMGRYIR